MIKDSKIYIAGINGMVGFAIQRRLEAEGYSNIIGPTSKELDLTNQTAVNGNWGRVFMLTNNVFHF